jgi:hypothetical protein
MGKNNNNTSNKKQRSGRQKTDIKTNGIKRAEPDSIKRRSANAATKYHKKEEAARRLVIADEVKKRRFLSNMIWQVVTTSERFFDIGDVCRFIESLHPYIPKTIINEIRASSDVFKTAVVQNCLNVARILADDEKTSSVVENLTFSSSPGFDKTNSEPHSILAHDHYGRDKFDVHEMFCEVCESGYLEMAKWLAERFRLVECVSTKKIACPALRFETFTCNAEREFFQAIYDPSFFNGTRALQKACENGRFLVARWLTELFKFTREGSKCDICYAFRRSCENGQFAVARWLADRFSLTSDDARAMNNYALLSSCAKGFLNIAKWLTNRFRLTSDDARDDNNYALITSCKNGYLLVAQWMANRFRLTIKDARENDNEAFRESCKNGHLLVAHWLTNRFKLTLDDARASDNYAFVKSIEFGHLDVTNWLGKRFGL